MLARTTRVRGVGHAALARGPRDTAAADQCRDGDSYGAEALLGRFAALAATGLLMVMLGGLLATEYALVWRLVVIPWAGHLPLQGVW